MTTCPKCGNQKIAICPICKKPVEVYSRVVGYHRPVQNWNIGKKEEYNDRLAFDQLTSMNHKFMAKHKCEPDEESTDEEVSDKENERPEQTS